MSASRYEHLRLETALRVDGRELAVDVLDLSPARSHPARHGLLGANDYVASLMVVCPGADAEQLARELDAVLAAAPAVTGAAGMLQDGVGVVGRILAPDRECRTRGRPQCVGERAPQTAGPRAADQVRLTCCCSLRSSAIGTIRAFRGARSTCCP